MLAAAREMKIVRPDRLIQRQIYMYITYDFFEIFPIVRFEVLVSSR